MEQGRSIISSSIEDKRQGSRQPVLKSAKVTFGASLIDCLVLDLSSSGVRVSTESFTPFPEQVTIEFRTGGVWAAERRWQRGMETGFEFTRFVGLNVAAAAAVSALYDQLRNAGVRDVAERLILARYFDHPELKKAAQATEAAVEALEQALRNASGRG